MKGVHFCICKLQRRGVFPVARRPQDRGLVKLGRRDRPCSKPTSRTDRGPAGLIRRCDVRKRSFWQSPRSEGLRGRAAVHPRAARQAVQSSDRFC